MTISNSVKANISNKYNVTSAKNYIEKCQTYSNIKYDNMKTIMETSENDLKIQNIYNISSSKE